MELIYLNERAIFWINYNYICFLKNFLDEKITSFRWVFDRDLFVTVGEQSFERTNFTIAFSFICSSVTLSKKR